MQTAIQARSTTDSVLSGLIYIDTLISGATSQGLYYVYVKSDEIDDSMIGDLQSNGYNVDIRYAENDHNLPTYIVNWFPTPTPSPSLTPSPTPSISVTPSITPSHS